MIIVYTILAYIVIGLFTNLFFLGMIRNSVSSYTGVRKSLSFIAAYLMSACIWIYTVYVTLSAFISYRKVMKKAHRMRRMLAESKGKPSREFNSEMEQVEEMMSKLRKHIK